MVNVPQPLGWGGDVTVLATCTHGRCSATHGVMLPFLQLAHMVDVPQHMGCGGWCYRSCNLHTWSMFRNTWGGGVMFPFLQLAHMVDVPQHMGWGGWWHSKTRLTGTQALDKVWSHLKRHVPKSLCSRSKSDRRFNPRMEQYVYSYMWRYNNRNWWKQLGQLCNNTEKRKTRVREWRFFFRCFLLPNLKSQKVSSAPSFGGFFTRR